MKNRIAVTASIFIVAACLLSGVVPAAAQTATNLKCNGCVGGKDIAKNAVTSAKIKNNSVGPSDLAAKAKLSGADFAGGNQIYDLGTTFQSVRSVTLNAPVTGVAIVTASGSLVPEADVTVRCSISDAGVFDSDFEVYAGGGATGIGAAYPFSSTRLFDVPAGATTFNLMCNESGGDGLVFDSVITAIFVPKRY